MERDVFMLGNAGLFELPKIAFLCSDKFSAGSVLRSYDWAEDMKRGGKCVISGFQSRLERDVLEILLGGEQPIIIALARGMFSKLPAKYKSHVNNRRLLLVSVFDEKIKQPNRDLALRRNQFVVDAADEVVFAHIHEGGMLSRLVLPEGKRVTVLDRQ